MTVFLSLIYKQGQVTSGHPIRGIFFEKTQGRGEKGLSIIAQFRISQK